MFSKLCESSFNTISPIDSPFQIAMQSRVSRLVVGLHFGLVGWVGDDPDQLCLGFYADEVFAGCSETCRSTSGVHLVVQGPSTCYPLDGQAKRQTTVSHSTPDAEIGAVAYGLRQYGHPGQILWSKIWESESTLHLYDDNSVLIRVAGTARNPTTRALPRTHGVCVWVSCTR